MEDNKNKELAKWDERLKPLLNGYFKSLFSEFIEEKIIGTNNAVIDKELMYHLNNAQLVEEAPATLIPLSDKSFTHLFELRNIARAVYRNSDFPNAKINDLPLSQILGKLADNGAYRIRWKNKTEIMTNLDQLDNLSGEPKIGERINELLKESNVNVEHLINQLLEYYGHEKIVKYFGETEKTDKLDLIGADFVLHDHPNAGNIYFNFKLRRNDPVPDTQSLLKAIKQLESSNQSSFLIQVVFTYESTGSFDKLKFQYRQILLNNLREYSKYTDRIKFIPVSTTGLEALDQEFEEFKKTYIQDQFSFVFENQSAPRGFPDRNDHFLERTFEIKNINFDITITPQKSQFWRFGFRFIMDETFPPLAQGRHEDGDVGDVCITAGDVEKLPDGTMKWKLPAQFTVTEYQVKAIGGEIRTLPAYVEQPVQLIAGFSSNATFELTVIVNGQPIGRKVYDLDMFKYFRLFAWCDQRDFQLHTDISISHGNPVSM